MKLVWRLYVFSEDEERVWVEGDSQEDIYRAMFSQTTIDELLALGYSWWHMLPEKISEIGQLNLSAQEPA